MLSPFPFLFSWIFVFVLFLPPSSGFIGIFPTLPYFTFAPDLRFFLFFLLSPPHWASTSLLHCFDVAVFFFF